MFYWMAFAILAGCWIATVIIAFDARNAARHARIVERISRYTR